MEKIKEKGSWNCVHYDSWDGFDSYFRCEFHNVSDKCPKDCKDWKWNGVTW